MITRISPRAEKEFKKLQKFDQIAIAQKIRTLIVRPVSGEEKLSGYSNVFRVRVGNYRIVYKKSIEELYIILIRHRRDVYKRLEDLLN